MGAVFSKPAQPRDKACISFNKGNCPSNAHHPSLLHVCSSCLYTVQRLCHHTEQFCKWKTQPKIGVVGWGLRQGTPVHPGYVGHTDYGRLNPPAPLLNLVPISQLIPALGKDTGIAFISLTAPSVATSQATTPSCIPAEAHSPSSHHPHMRAPWPLELSAQMQDTGDNCIKQTSFPNRSKPSTSKPYC